MAAGRGFTLIEVMVVIVIVAILVTFAALSIGRDRTAVVDEEVRRFTALVDLAADEAILRGREIGIQFHRHGYRFSVFEMQEVGRPAWPVIGDDRLLRPRELSADITVRLRVDGLELPLPAEPPSHGDPQVILSSGGERTSFDLTLSIDDGGSIYAVGTGGDSGRQ